MSNTSNSFSFNGDTGIISVSTPSGPHEMRIRVATDRLDLEGAGAPVDYTDGSPPATGEGIAGIGSSYVDITAGKMYLNGGTKAQPIWKLVTSAA